MNGRRLPILPRTLITVTLLALSPAARAGETETRVFHVLVDGKRCGEARMAIAHQPDGTTVATCTTDVTVRVLFYTYRYTYQGREVWKAGRLLQLDSTCDDGGKQYRVTARADGDGLRVRVNDRARRARPDVWLTSYWGLPEPARRNGLLPVLDADNGRDLDGRLHYLGEQQIAVEGRLQNAAHYRLTGPAPVDLWYDAADRLVRREGLEDGRRVVLQLARVER